MERLKPTPPSWATRFLLWFLKEDYFEDIQGDLEEEFQIRAEDNTLTKARKWYTWQIIRLFKPGMIKKLKAQDSIEKETTMFKNYVKIGLRNLWKYKAGTAINVIGLSTGLAAFVLIALFVKDELSYDLHHEHAENVYRVTVKNYTSEGDVSRHWAFASAGHATRLKDDYAEITHSVRIHPWAFPDILVDEKKFPSEPVIFVGDDMFDIFTFKFIQGTPETALVDLYSLVLTETTATKLYGSDWREQNLVGKSLVLEAGGNEIPFKVTAVMEDMPDQQHFHFDYLAPIRLLEQFYGERTMNFVGGNYNWLTYIRVPPGTNIEALQQQTNDEFWDKYIGIFEGTYQTGERARGFYDFVFQPILDIHLKSNLDGEYEANGSIQQIYIFSIVGILLLLVACVNYMNLATSHYSRRMKEVGVRKVIGAFKSTLMKQFLTESTLITAISFPLSILLILWGLPYLNDFVDKAIIFNPINEFGLLVLLLLLLVGVGVLAGIYPAIFLSRINLVQALKGEQAVNANKWNFRSWLVTFQYAVTIALIFAIVVIESQMQFIRNADAGYTREHVLRVRVPRQFEKDLFKNDLLTNPKILNASYSSRIPTGRLSDSWGARIFAGDSTQGVNFRLSVLSIDPDYFDTYEIDLIAGDHFREGEITVIDYDTITASSYIVNKRTIEALGFQNPQDAIGYRMGYGVTQGRIVGVCEDFHFESMHEEIAPIIFIYHDNYRSISLRLNPDDLRSTLDFIENTYTKYETERSISYKFVDELFEQQYDKEQRLGTMIKVFAVLAILIGCLGLVGMVGFIIETKIKEIGVRKVLGASTTSIWILISKRFIVLASIAFFIALPITYYLMDGWLQNFVYRTGISLLTISSPILLTLLLTMIAISYQTIKATRVNPVECLKDE